MVNHPKFFNVITLLESKLRLAAKKGGAFVSLPQCREDALQGHHRVFQAFCRGFPWFSSGFVETLLPRAGR